jgi:hypothetical protein
MPPRDRLPSAAGDRAPPLLSIEDAVEAMRRAGASVYEPAST